MKYTTIVIIFFLMLTFSCTKKDSEKKDTLNIALSSAIPEIDPALSYDTVSAQVVYQIYESLYEYDYLIRPYRIKPLLAEGLPIIEDNGKKYTIKIKPNLFYHSTNFMDKNRFVTAQDFINQIRRIAYPGTKSKGWWLFADKIVGLDEFRSNAKSDFSDFYQYPIEGLQATDEKTLVIKLKRPYPQLIYALAMTFTSPMPKELIDQYKNDFSQNAIGTGPYYLKSWDRDLKLKLHKFDRYHESTYPDSGDRFAFENKLLEDKGKSIPFIENITFHILKEAQTTWLKFQSKQIDYIILNKDHFALALDENGKLKQEFVDQGIQLQISPTLTYWWLAFNMQDPIVGKNLNLRKAIAHAIDIDKYINIFTNNIALKANSIYPPGIPGYNPSNRLPYEYDIEKAKNFLKLAGYPEGKGLPVIQYDIRGASTTARQMGEFISSELAKIGIKINIVVNTFQGFLMKANAGELQFWQGGWAMDYPDAENTVQLLLKNNFPPGPNTSYFTNPEIEKLFEVVSFDKDQIVKKEAMSNIENIVHQNLPWIMQYYSRNYILLHKEIKNFRQSDLINNYIKYIRIQ